MDTPSSFTGHGLDTPPFSFVGQSMSARVVDVYDGDTMSVVLPIGAAFYKFHVRLHGIDASELKSKRACSKTLAMQARTEVLTALGVPADSHQRKESQKYLEANLVVVKMECFEFDKFGRILANVYPMGSSDHLSNTLLRAGLAYEYNGGTKKTCQEQEEFLTKQVNA